MPKKAQPPTAAPTRSKVIRLRVTEEEAAAFREKAAAKGYPTISEYIRAACLNEATEVMTK